MFFEDEVVADNNLSMWNKGKGCLVIMLAQSNSV
jgi:hypothetical protein